MGALTRLQVIAQVRYGLDNRQDFTDAQVLQWMDWTLLHLAHPKVYEHPGLKSYETVVLVLAQEAYNLTGTTVLVTGVRNTTAGSGYKLEPKGRDWFRQRRRDSVGRPSYYMRDWFSTAAIRQVRVHPVPSAEYVGQQLEVERIFRPTLWSALLGGATSALEAEWDEAQVLGAIWRGWRHLRNYPLADRAKADFAAMVNELGGLDQLEMEYDQRDFDIVAPQRTSRY